MIHATLIKETGEQNLPKTRFFIYPPDAQIWEILVKTMVEGESKSPPDSVEIKSSAKTLKVIELDNFETATKLFKSKEYIKLNYGAEIALFYQPAGEEVAYELDAKNFSRLNALYEKN